MAVPFPGSRKILLWNIFFLNGSRLYKTHQTLKLWQIEIRPKPIKITSNRDCRQGCSLSPLLFTLAIEPFEIATCHPQFLLGFWLDLDHKMSLFADNVILFLSNLSKSINHSEIIKSFSSISGYKINKTKSSISCKRESQSGDVLQFNVVSQFEYSGIQIFAGSKTISRNKL